MSISMKGMLKVFFVVVFLVSPFFIGNGLSQGRYPAKPITMVVPWASGMMDTMTRAICMVAEKELGQPIVVENKPGASSAIGMNYVLKSKPDGYTLGVVATSGLTITPHVQKISFNVLTDMVDVLTFCKYNQLLLVRADSPWNTYEELIAYAKKAPGKFKFAVSGIAATQRICMERIAMKEGIKWTAVPFKSGGEAVLAALGGHTDGVTQSSLESSDHIKTGKLKLLLVLSDSRLPEFSNVPTIREKGYNFDAAALVSIFGPAGIPEQVRQRLEDVFKKAMEDPSFIETAKRFQIETPYMSGKKYSEYWRSQYDEMGKVIKSLGLEEK